MACLVPVQPLTQISSNVGAHGHRLPHEGYAFHLNLRCSLSAPSSSYLVIKCSLCGRAHLRTSTAPFYSLKRVRATGTLHWQMKSGLPSFLLFSPSRTFAGGSVPKVSFPEKEGRKGAIINMQRTNEGASTYDFCITG